MSTIVPMSDTHTRNGAQSKTTREDSTALRNAPHGIQMLPDEVILKIMEQAISKCGDAVGLMLVCSRFSSIATSPTVWAKCKLSFELTPEQISNIVRRSRGLPLTAELHEGPPGKFCWTLGEFHGIEGGSIDATEILQHCALFEEIVIDMPFSSATYWRDRLSGYPTPRLSRLRTSFIPKPMAQSMITECSLHLKYIPYCDLLDFLDSVPFLVSLSILTVFRDYPRDELETSRIVTLKSLRHLTLSVSIPNAYSITALADNLELDALENLAIYFIKFLPQHYVQPSDVMMISRWASKNQSSQALRVFFLVDPLDPGDRPEFFSTDMTIESFLASVACSMLNDLIILDVCAVPHFWGIRWSYSKDKRSQPEESDRVMGLIGRNLTTESLLDLMRGKPTEQAHVGIVCPFPDPDEERVESISERQHSHSVTNTGLAREHTLLTVQI